MVPMVKMEPQREMPTFQPTFQPIPQADLGAYETGNRPYFQAQSIPYQGRSNFGQAPQPSATSSRNRSDQVPKSLCFDPTKTTWEAFYMKFDNYAREHHWSSQECKSNLMYILEGKAAEFFC